MKYDHLGNGLSKDNDKVIFIKRAIPGEVVDVDIVNNKKKYQLGKINKIIKASPNRIKSVCPFYDKCGGCNFLHTNLKEEKKFKIGKAKELISSNVNFFNTKEFNYRNKVKLHVKDKKIGFYQEKTNELIAIDYCYLLNDQLNDILGKINNYINENSCCINDITIRCASEVLLIVNGKVGKNFIKNFDFVDNIVINGNVIKGKGYIETKIDKYRFKISPESFFQVNYQGLETIFKILQDNLKGKYKKALDLYSGTSVMGILISNFCENVISVEINKEATMDALVNVKNNQINNLQIINEKVENIIETLNDIDLIIVDPPRSGLDYKTIEYILKLKPKTLVYISCDMITLKRDLELLKDIYVLKNLNLVDMFPKTYHVESIAILDLKL